MDVADCLPTDHNNSLWCEACQKFCSDGPCSLHARMVVDQPLLSRAFATLPKCLEIVQKPWMTEPGVFATAPIDDVCIFGPLVGEVTASSESSQTFRYSIVITEGAPPLFGYRLDSDDQCNWMKYVRSADTPTTANTIAFQQHFQIYFAPLKPIQQSEELRVCLWGKYATATGKSNGWSPSAEGVEGFFSRKTPNAQPLKRRKKPPTKTGRRKRKQKVPVVKEPAGEEGSLVTPCVNVLVVPPGRPKRRAVAAKVYQPPTMVIAEAHPNELEDTSVVEDDDDMDEEEEGSPEDGFPEEGSPNDEDQEGISEGEEDNEEALETEEELGADISDEIESDEGELSGGEEDASVPGRPDPMIPLLEAVITLNPYQFRARAPECTAAWQGVLDKVLKEPCGAAGFSNLDMRVYNTRRRVNRHLRFFRQNRLDWKQSSFKPNDSTVKNDLFRQIDLLQARQPPPLPREKSAGGGGGGSAAKQTSAFKFGCNKCSASFRTEELLDVHGYRHGKKLLVKWPTSCPAKDCSFSDPALLVLLDHVDKHKRRLYRPKSGNQCQDCPGRPCFSTPESLAIHTQRVHTEPDTGKLVECLTCQRRFVNLSGLRAHERTHMDAFYRCPVCLISLPSSNEMQEHAETHRIDGQFPCPHCGKTYPEFHSMRSHMTGYHGRTYTCQVCQKVFKQVSGYNRHQALHSAVFAFACDVCGRRFKWKEKLMRHKQKLHNPDRVTEYQERSEKVASAFADAVVCQFCTRQYANKERLLIHQRKQHLGQLSREIGFDGAGHGSTRT